MVDTSTFDRLNDSFVSVNSLTNEQCNILLAGDFNNRTSDNADYVAFDSDSNFGVLPDAYIADKCLPRFSQDKGHSNSNGTFLLDLCKQTGLCLLNGTVGSDAGIENRKENPQKLTQLSSRSHPRHLMGKRTAQKVTIIDITSDSQVKSNFPYRWSAGSLTFNNYFTYFYIYI